MAVAAQPTGLHVIDRIKVGGTGGWDYPSIDEASGRLYVAHGGGISAVELKTKAAFATFADGRSAHVALPINGGKDLLITHGNAGQVTINDALTGRVKAVIASDLHPDSAIVEPQTLKVFVTTKIGTVDVIDVATQKITARISVGGVLEGVAVDGAGLVLTHRQDPRSIVVIDARTAKQKALVPIPDCEDPTGIAFVAKGRLVLSACGNGIARVTALDTGKKVAAIPVGSEPDSALYDPKANLGYIPSVQGTLTVIGFEGKPHRIEVVQTKAGARTAAFDPRSGNIYLPTADLIPPPKPDQHPGVVPDTFEILVVGK